MGDFGPALLSGISVGCIYALVAVGFTIVFKAGGVLNFAQGSIMVLAAFVGAAIAADTTGGAWIGLLVAAVAAGVISCLLYLLVLRSMTGADAFRLTIMTMGLSFVINAILALIWGDELLQVPLVEGRARIDLGIGTLSGVNAIGIGVTLLVFLALQITFRRTRSGLQLRAASEAPGLAMRSGIDVVRLYAFAWLLAGTAAGIGGVLLAASSSASVGIAEISLRAFPAAVLGGFGSIPGALVGGVLIGVIQQFTVFYIDATAANAITYVVLLLVLLVRPAGLLGRAALERA